jgi:hypothetical protein
MVAFLVVGTLISVLFGISLGKFLLPVIQALFVFPLFLFLVSRQQWRRAFVGMALWAFLSSVVIGVASYGWNEAMGSVILNAREYQGEMFHWIRTGVGPEGDLRQFLPQHLLHFGVFSLVTFLSVGFLGLVMGSILVNYMSFYVGTLLIQAERFWIVLVLAWPPWAVFRVLGFILAAIFFSAIAIRILTRSKEKSEGSVQYLAIGGIFLVSDVLLKWTLAPTWRVLLEAFTLL